MANNIESPRVIVALDHTNPGEAMSLVDMLNPSLCRLKVGNILFTQAGPRWVEQLIARGFDVFLDLKYHDIPNTVVGAVQAASDMGVWMVNVHVSGGVPMLRALQRWMQDHERRPICLGVTVLTSLTEADLQAIGCNDSLPMVVSRLAGLAQSYGLDGVVCSAHEAGQLRSQLGDDFLLVTPGIRQNGEHQDQQRVMTPRAALAAGSDYLVMGRAITEADDPVALLKQLL